MLFCPGCNSTLLLSVPAHAGLPALNSLDCPACPYSYPLEQTLCKRLPLPRKQLDDVLGGDDAWKNVDSTDVICPKCEHPRAYFMQIQIRSADEPSSIFYKCHSTTCSHQWREG